MIRSVLLNRKQATPQSVSGSSDWSRYGAYDEVWAQENRTHYVDAYIDRVWVQRCVNLISKSATQVGLRAMQRGEPLEEHRIIDLLKRPNPRDPAAMFFETSIFWSQVVGDWQWEAIPARDGTIAELYPLRSHLVRVKPGRAGRVAGYLYDPTNSGNPTSFEACDPAGALVQNGIIAGRFGNPLDDWYGLPPLRGAKDDIISEYYAIRYDHRFFQNSARPDVALTFKDKLSKDQREANKQSFQEFKGVDQAFKALILDGDADIQVVSQNQKDVEYLEGRRLAREGECAAFGVPPVLVGDLTRATYSNYKESETIFWKSTMLPLLEYFATWANATIVPYFPDVEEIAFDTSAIQALQESENDRMERLVRGISGGVTTPNEARQDAGLEELDDPEANRIYLPLSLVPVAGEGVAAENEEYEAKLDAARKNPPPAPPVPGQAPQLAVVPDAEEEKSRKAVPQAWVRKRATLLNRITPLTAKRISKVYSTQAKAITTLVAGKSKATDIAAALEAYPWAEDQAALEAIVTAMRLVVGDEAYSATSTLLGAEVSFDEQSPIVRDMLRELDDRPDGIRTVMGRTKDDVIEQVRIGIENGIPQRGIATGGTFDIGPAGDRQAQQITIKGVEGVYDEYKTWQAERIARTESAHTYNRASAQVMREAGVTEVDIQDGDDDDECGEANGQRWTLDEYESNPLGHPNCTRVGIPVIE